MARSRLPLCGLLIVTLSLPVLAGEPDGEPQFIGYGGPNGSRVYPDAKPPVQFGLKKEEGFQWETPLPSWGHGSPVAVAGKVFVMCEPGKENVFPLLICMDGETGRILWQREIDHLPAITADKAERATLRKRIASKKRSPKHDKELNARMGYVPDPYKVQDQHGRGEIGVAYATPVTDGAFIYASTAWGGYACFDFDGRMKWLTYSPGAGNTWNNRAPSPIIHDGLLIHSNVGSHRAFDCRTGEQIWKHDVPFGSIATGTVISVNGKHVYLSPSVTAYLLPGGKEVEVTGWRDAGMQMLTKYDEPDVVFFCGSGEHCSWQKKGRGDPPYPPAALRFAWEGDRLKATVLWHGGQIVEKKNRSAPGGNAPWMTYHNGRLLHRHGVQLDAATGRIVAGSFGRWDKDRAVPRTRHFLAVANGHIYGLGRENKWDPVIHVYTLDGRHVATNEIGSKGDYGGTFTFDGPRIYIRVQQSLLCFAAEEKGGDK